MRLICIDFETRYDSEYTLKKLSTAEYIFDPRFKALGVSIKVEGKPTVYTDQVAAVLAHFKDELESGAVLAHHAQFDGLILAHHFGITPRFWFDTLSMARALGIAQVSGGLSLQALAAHYNLGSKTELRPDSTPEELRARATQDAELTWALFGKLVKGYPADELRAIDWTIRCFTEPHLQLNQPRCTSLITELRTRKQQLLDELGVDQQQLGSSEQFAALLRNLGVEPPTKPSPADPSKLIYAFAKTDEAMRDLGDCGDEQVEALVAARLDLKSNGDLARAERLQTLWTLSHSLPVYLSYAAAHTQRWGGGDGTNFQNLSKPRKDARGEVVRGSGEIRKCLEAPAGYVLVVGDLAQIECRLTMWLAEQIDVLEAFERGDDLYSELATDIFGYQCSKSTTLERFVGKTATLGCGFGMGPDKFRDTVRRVGRVEIEQQTAQEAVSAYRRRYPGVPRLWKRAERLLGNPGVQLGPVVSEGEALLLPNGMRLFYPDLRRDAQGQWSVRSRKGNKRINIWGGTVTENIAQALARIVITEQLLQLHTPELPICTMTHDELVMVVPEGAAAAAKQRMQEVLTCGPAWTTGLPLAAEVAVNRVYGEAK